MLPALLLVTVLPADLGVARLELSAGRADIVSAAGVTSLVGRSAAHDVDGRAYVELGAASQLALRWRGEASLELRGAAAVEWRAPADQRGVLFTAWRVSELDFEVRRGPLRLDVGGGWRLELDVGAAGLRTLADGRLEVRHVAGAPLRISRDLGDGLVTPPWTLLPGGEVRLDAGALSSAPLRGAGSGAEFRGRALGPPAPGGERFAPPQPWAQFAWPWAAPTRPTLLAPWPARSASEQPESAAPARIESGRIAPASSSHGAQPESSDAGHDAAHDAAHDESLELPQARSRARDAAAPAARSSADGVSTPHVQAEPTAPAPQAVDGASEAPSGAVLSTDATPQGAAVAPTGAASTVGVDEQVARESAASGQVVGTVSGAASDAASGAVSGATPAGNESASRAADFGELGRAVQVAAWLALLVQRNAPYGFALDTAPSAPATKRAPFDASRYAPLRRDGELVLTPFGPRWSERP